VPATIPAVAVYIARHGESAWNAERRVQGQTDVPLSERGRAQAALLGQRLAAAPLDAIFTSDLARARDTAAVVAEAQARVRGVRPRFVVLPALRERDYGSWEGKSAAEVRALREQLHHAHAAARPGAGGARPPQPAGETVSPPDAPPDGEPFDALERRLLGAWDEIAADLGANGGAATILVVGHGAALRGLLCGLTGTPPSEQARWQLDNASLSRLRWEDGTVRVDFWNDRAHLAGQPRHGGDQRPEQPGGPGPGDQREGRTG
jgi:2,3-bisphosphoglycerate-dependent phosphoglycerate mutase